MRPEVAVEWIEQLEAFPCLDVDASLVKTAAEIRERYAISYCATSPSARPTGASHEEETGRAGPGRTG